MQEKKSYKMCQSCGMPLKKDPNGGGSEKDGSKSTMYCSYCYENGDFIAKNISLEDMKEANFKIMTEKLKMPKFLAKLANMNLKNLERWKKHK